MKTSSQYLLRLLQMTEFKRELFRIYLHLKQETFVSLVYLQCVRKSTLWNVSALQSADNDMQVDEYRLLIAKRQGCLIFSF